MAREVYPYGAHGPSYCKSKTTSCHMVCITVRAVKLPVLCSTSTEPVRGAYVAQFLQIVL
jgi:hypothetical protein